MASANTSITDIIATTIQNRSGTLADNVTNNNALLRKLKAKGNVRPFGGGNVILEEIMYVDSASINANSYSGYEAINIGVNSPISAAQFSIVQYAAAVTMSGLEMLQNASKEQIIDLLEGRVKLTEAQLMNRIDYDMYQDGTGNGGKNIVGLASAVADTPTSGTYGGISRAGASGAFWEGQYINATSIVSGAGTVATVGFTRASMAATILKIMRGAGGELPDCIILSIPDFATLSNDVIGVENVYVTPGMGAGNNSPDAAVRSGFMNLNIASVPVFCDPFCPVGHAFAPNSKYTYMMINDDMNFAFSGFQSLVPVNQIGQQGIVTLGYNVVCTKPVSGAHVYGIGNPAFS